MGVPISPSDIQKGRCIQHRTESYWRRDTLIRNPHISELSEYYSTFFHALFGMSAVNATSSKGNCKLPHNQNIFPESAVTCGSITLDVYYTQIQCMDSDGTCLLTLIRVLIADNIVHLYCVFIFLPKWSLVHADSPSRFRARKGLRYHSSSQKF